MLVFSSLSFSRPEGDLKKVSYCCSTVQSWPLHSSLANSVKRFTSSTFALISVLRILSTSWLVLHKQQLYNTANTPSALLEQTSYLPKIVHGYSPFYNSPLIHHSRFISFSSFEGKGTQLFNWEAVKSKQTQSHTLIGSDRSTYPFNLTIKDAGKK